MDMPAEFLNWFPGDRDKVQQLRHAFNACLNLARAYQLRCEALNDLQNIPTPPVEAPAQVDEPEVLAPAQFDAPEPEVTAIFSQLAADREVGESEPQVAA
jgi:hypothetical protein